MNHSTNLNRRLFLQAAGATGASFAAIPEFLAQAVPEISPGITSLNRERADFDSPDLPPLAPPDKQPPHLVIPEPQVKAGWAVMGLGGLALEQILPAFGACKKSQLVALVSGHPKKARKLAEVYGVDSESIYDYDNFESIKDNPEVDIVYVVLPNSMHAEFSVRALECGKHVLCEKPMASTVAECESMIATAAKADRKLAIGYRLHYEPLNIAASQWCREKKLGDIKTFKASNCQTTEAPNIRLSGPLGGGPLGDLGIYCINAARYTIGEEPTEAIATQTPLDPASRFREVPEAVSFLLRYPSGVTAICECSFGTAKSSTYQVLCERGVIEMDPAYMYSGLRLWTEGSEGGIPMRKDVNLPQINQFASEMDDFSDCVLHDKASRTPGEMGLQDLKIILAVLESARLDGEPVRIG